MVGEQHSGWTTRVLMDNVGSTGDHTRVGVLPRCSRCGLRRQLVGVERTLDPPGHEDRGALPGGNLQVFFGKRDSDSRVNVARINGAANLHRWSGGIGLCVVRT